MRTHGGGGIVAVLGPRYNSRMENESSDLEGAPGGRLGPNVLWNLAGQIVPLCVAFVAFPLLIGGMTPDTYGALTLVLTVVGFFALFDLGLGRALTQRMARSLGAGRDRELPSIVWTSMLLMLILGIVGGAALGGLSPLLVRSVLNVPPDLQPEVLHSFLVLAVLVPVMVTSAGFGGILVASRRFDLLNAVRIPMGIFVLIGPLAALQFTQNLFVLVAVMAAVHATAWMVLLLLCLRVLPSLPGEMRFRRDAAAPLIRFGLWVSVSNVVGLLMHTLDRFLIGAGRAWPRLPRRRSRS